MRPHGPVAIHESGPAQLSASDVVLVEDVTVDGLQLDLSEAGLGEQLKRLLLPQTAPRLPDR
jgi:hypothetical protein